MSRHVLLLDSLSCLLCLLLSGCGDADADEAKAKTTATGLKLYDVQVGEGAEALPGTWVEVHYVGRLRDGKKFDSSRERGKPLGFLIGHGMVVKGWDEGVAGMKVGGKRKLWIPPELGYGARGAGNGDIPPNAELLFEVELVNVKPGVEIKDLKEGEGPPVKRGDRVEVHYTGRLRNGVKFDSSYDQNKPFPFKIGAGEVIPGWDVGVPGMKVGGKRKLTIAPELAYGERGQGEIPPNAELIFEIELVAIR